MRALGVDLGGTSVKCVVFEDGQERGSGRAGIETNAGCGASTDIRNAIDLPSGDQLRPAGPDPRRVIGAVSPVSVQRSQI